MSDLFRSETRGTTLILYNNNVDMRNALSPEYLEGLLRGVENASCDPKISSIILMGVGGYFCSGGDLTALRRYTSLSYKERYSRINSLHEVIREIRSCPKPVIAAVEGGAAGAGVSLALACDMVVSDLNAKFTLAHVRAGLTPDGGATHMLMQILPRATVARMALLAHPIRAEKLFELGAITELVESGNVFECAYNLTEQVARGPETAITSIKNLMNLAENSNFEVQLDEECSAMAKAMGTEEAKIGIDAVLNKRVPTFR